MRLRKEFRLTAQEIADKLTLARSSVAGWLQQARISKFSHLP
ncbi:hypothetical protein [Pseudovibrio sp. Tun.PSC04-5.I4]|nr:hypothetical protein [Pseudovibrio sp. Tun.PSC04-5.I4]